MFKLKFFILFVLAGLCFGDPSGSETGASHEDQSPGGNSQDSSPPGNGQSKEQVQERGQEEEPKEEPNEEQREEKLDDKEEESSTKDKEKPLGHALPGFIGNSTQKRQYVIILQSNCDGQNQMYKINENEINFKKCAYTCTRLGDSPENVERRIPKDMICDKDNMKCPEKGDCPNPPLPSC